MNEVEAVGEVASGAMLARAVEPDTGEAPGAGHDRACLNCDTALVGAHCHACGQRGEVHRTVSAFVHDLLHGVLHFEGKIWRTVPLLAWKPGMLTRRYVEGQRATFVSPIALFLFSVFLMFAVISSIGVPTDIDSKDMKSELAADASKEVRKIEDLEAQRAAALARREPTVEIDRQIIDARKDARLVRELADQGVVRGSAAGLSKNVPQWLAAPLRRAADNPALLLYKVQNNAYKYSWALVPLSLPFMWLLFPFSRRFRLYDHIVFVTYSLAFMTLLVVAASLLHAIGLGVIAGFMMLLPPLHMYRQLKGAYGLSRWGALWRTTLLIGFALTVAALFVALLFAAGMV